MGTLQESESVEHDGKSQIKLHSSSPIECIGDAQVLQQIFSMDQTEDSTQLDS